MIETHRLTHFGLAIVLALAGGAPIGARAAHPDTLRQSFVTPPDTAKPWVYWFFMDGNETQRGMRADLEALQKAGIGGVIRMDVNLGVPKGPVAFMSPEWRDNFVYGVREAKRLGLQFSLETGPGWCGDGGPWIKPEESMQHLVASETTVAGPAHFDELLPRPKPRPPFFGEGTMTEEGRRQWLDFYQDVSVVAFPTPAGNARIDDVDSKAFYYRGSVSSGQVPWQFDPPAGASVPGDQCIPAAKVIELTAKLGADGRLSWDVPAGNWTIMRFGRTTTGQTTRPAPDAGLGFESDKFDREGVAAQFDAFVGNLLGAVGPKYYGGSAGLTMLHFDSWEVSSQNWSARFRQEFTQRRGYDPAPYLPVMTGHIVGSRERSERFLWDLRQTASDLIVGVHARYLADYAHQHGLTLSVEPYDLNPSADMDLGGMADLPMCEFWSNHYALPSNYSCIEVVSVAHTNGRKIVGAESFTAAPNQDWRQFPGVMKEQLDWALCAGINKFVIHRSQHQPDMDKFPGMMMGPYGVNWERTQTWWDMAPAFHRYIARCCQMLRQGLPVSDILYVTPEGAPQVFAAPDDALTTSLDANLLPDHKGYGFDGCSPLNLIAHAKTRGGRIVFPDGMSYRVLVLPHWDTMTPALLRKVTQLVEDGAVVIGAPPSKSPSLANYPACDAEVQSLAAHLWGAAPYAAARAVGRGRVLLDTGQGTNSANLSDAQWIWFDEGDPARDAPAGARYFRKTIEILAGRKIKSAVVTMSADNSFALSVNGRAAGGGLAWSTPAALDISKSLKPGKNAIGVTAVNDAGTAGANPAGLIGKIEIEYADGERQTVVTDAGWTASQTAMGEFTAAKVLGPYGMGPWGASARRTTVYQNYAATAAQVRGLGIAPDFSSGKPIRYIHRHLPDGELYFIANKSGQAITTRGVFRVAGLQPEWWDALSGSSRRLGEYSAAHGLTTIPIRLGPFESGFVLFRKPTMGTAMSAENFPQYRTLMTLIKPWSVAFDPQWGGPAHIDFARLDDWSKRPETDIQHYSGKAIYTTTFDAPRTALQASSAALSLGDVKNLAAVRLNGRDLGIVWCAPWRVSIPAGVLKPAGNTLEVTVANLWVNRLIGDSGKPEAQRLTSVTYNNYHPDSPLEPSGLLGPVTLQSIKQ
ncbi:hypothetical protein CCAX7_15420 [Capsulimonas corticalis]|uniref:Uncharacterized protein n=1 Tax=Capsulimonas corticalis TaxID=2219043 RepID=A0A402CZ94_9BACT|nr:glycosyl hydrolase [Capsulimonas corticalis]BDI29491.1 hypothetical protein CCAX7_15420 [Capsulimonas corticalis]